MGVSDSESCIQPFEGCIQTLSEELLDVITREQLLEVVVNYETGVSTLQKRSEEGIKSIIVCVG